MDIEPEWRGSTDSPTYIASYDPRDTARHDYDIDVGIGGTWNSNTQPVDDDGNPNASGQSSSQGLFGMTSKVLSRPKSRGSIVH